MSTNESNPAYIPSREGWHRFNFELYRRIQKVKRILALTDSIKKGIIYLKSENYKRPQYTKQ